MKYKVSLCERMTTRESSDTLVPLESSVDTVEIPRLAGSVLVLPGVALNVAETFLDVEDFLIILKLLLGLGSVERLGLKVGRGGTDVGALVDLRTSDLGNELGRSDLTAHSELKNDQGGRGGGDRVGHLVSRRHRRKRDRRGERMTRLERTT